MDAERDIVDEAVEYLALGCGFAMAEIPAPVRLHARLYIPTNLVHDAAESPRRAY